jgi:O-antigen biosynthesis protein
MTDLSVIIATRHRAAALAGCLDSLLVAAGPGTEVLVVDNGPDPDTEAVVAARQGGAVPLRYLVETTPGASRARNVGLAAAAGGIVAVTDDDVVVDSEWLDRLTAGFDRAPDVAAVTGLVLPGCLDSPAQALFEAWGGFNKGYEPRLFGPEAPAGAGPLYPYSPGLYGSGNNVAFRTSVLRAVGGYDIALGPGTPARAGEELDLFLALITSGHRIAYEPAAVVWHHHRASEAELATQLHAYGIGLSALMTKWALTSPAHAADLARRLPAGALALRRRGPSRPPAGAAPVVKLPARLRRRELTGMLRGPIALLAGRRAAGRPLLSGGPRLPLATATVTAEVGT